MITPIQKTNYNFQTARKPVTPAFQGAPAFYCAAHAEKAIRSVEFSGRKFVNRFFDFFHKKTNMELYNKLLNTDTKSEEYISLLSQVSRIFSNQKEVEINLESGRLEKIAASNRPQIFIMNHDNQNKDPQMLAFFNTLLNYEYIKNGLAKTCPRPRIILNEDILLSMSEQNRNLFKKLGAVGIDASITGANSRANAATFIKLVKEFIKGETNIFIFPEGKNAIKKKAPLVEKFQLGTAEIVTKIADKMPDVNITPLGFAYGKKSNADSIYIGETLVFKKQGKHMETSVGNIQSPFARQNYKDFYKNKDKAIITNNSIPVEGKELSPYVGGILCENLRICREEALAAIHKSHIAKTIQEKC